jgi:Ca2+-binding EF-hand superfamily protein
MPTEEELRVFFDKFDKEKQGFIPATSVATILKTMGVTFNTQTLRELITEFDEDGSGTFEFEEFCALVCSVEEDEPASEEELREIFRLFDKQGQGFISTDVLREILGALDDKLTKADLDAAIEEIDEDGSGTVDFAEFKEMMNG